MQTCFGNKRLPTAIMSLPIYQTDDNSLYMSAKIPITKSWSVFLLISSAVVCLILSNKTCFRIKDPQCSACKMVQILLSPTCHHNRYIWAYIYLYMTFIYNNDRHNNNHNLIKKDLALFDLVKWHSFKNKQKSGKAHFIATRLAKPIK